MKKMLRRIFASKSTAFASELLMLCIPIVFGQLGHMFVGVGALFIAGHHSTLTLSALGLGNGLINPIFVVGLGFSYGIAPLLSIMMGEGRVLEVKKTIWTIFLLSIFMGLLLTIGLYTFSHIDFFIPGFFDEVLKFDPEVIPLIKLYIRWVSFSILGAYIFTGIKEFLLGQQNVFVANVLAVIAVFLNILVAGSFAFGFWIFPEMGIRGIAMGAISVRYFLAIALFIYARKYFKIKFHINTKFLKEVVVFSIPIALAVFIEVAAFAFIGLLSGRIGIVSSAAHYIIANLTSVTFMIPLSLCLAVSVKIGHAYGAKNLKNIKYYAKAALLISVTFMTCTGIAFYLLPEFFIGVFTQDNEVIALATKLLFIAALYQIFDGAQITFGGISRGIERPHYQTWAVIFAYWTMAVPTGIYLAFYAHQGVIGLWTGVAMGVFVCAIILGVLIFRLLAKKQDLFKKSRYSI